MASFSLIFFNFVYFVIIFLTLDTFGLALYREICNIIEIKSGMHCDESKKLKCRDGQCECIDDFVPDGDCGCKLGLVGYGAPCLEQSVHPYERCDAEKHLRCSNLLHKCICNINHVRSGEGCVVGTGIYGDPCDVSDDYRHAKHFDRHQKLKPVGRLRRSLDDPEEIKKFVEVIESTEFKEWRVAQIRVIIPSTTNELLNESIPALTQYKCKPLDFPDATKLRNKTEGEFSPLNSTKLKGCKPHMNIHCVNGTCQCINTGFYKMYDTKKISPTVRIDCKKSNLYICKNSEECISGNCVKVKLSHENEKICAEKGFKFETSDNVKSVNGGIIIIFALTVLHIKFL